ncbi:MAG: hypothetical protein MJ240_11980 [Kiritimatiellae bacterium]|nr:hypothetical protein [Kiritimatiellia bacterium]
MAKLVALMAAVAVWGLHAAEWDFTGGLPAGGKMARDGYVTEAGLASHSITNIRSEGGYRLDRPFSYPATFRFEAEVDLGLPDSGLNPNAWRTDYLWDDIGEAPNAQVTDGRGVSVMVHHHRGARTLFLRLGFGDHTEVLHGPELPSTSGTRAKIAFTYAANGKVTWETPKGRRVDICQGKGTIPSGKRPTKIGDRVWPNWYKFDGIIRRVAVLPVENGLLDLSVASPRAFIRASGQREFRVELTNSADSELKAVDVTLTRGEERIVRHLPSISAWGSQVVGFPVETRLKPGWRACKVTAKGISASGRELRAEMTTAIGIGPRPGDRMLALMQDSNALVKECADCGLTTGQFGDGSRFFVRDIPPARNDSISHLREALDEALVAGIGYGFSGKHDQPTFDEAPAFARVWEDYGRAFSEYDAFQLAVPYSERRDKSYPDLQKDAARFKAATGLDMPPEVVSNRVASFKTKKYPDGVVPENDPVLAFYRWYWSGGDRWPEYFSRFGAAIRRGVGREGFQTLWDPGVRCPPRWGSGGDNNLLSQWIYPDPEPMAVAGSAEEILAMCAGRPGQKPVIHTQLMCYSRRIAPNEVAVSPRPAWQDRFGGGKFLATPADVACEATWLMFAKPMYGYSFYPFTCMVETSATWYPYSDPRLGPEMRRLFKEVLAPLGPMFKRLGRAEPEVAVFESFTSTVMGAPFAMGWNAPPVTFMQRANLDPKVVYEESLERDGFGDLKVVFAPNCRHLTPKHVALFRDFQAKGGVLVGDGELLKALKADITVPTVRFAPPPKSDWVTDVEENQSADPKIAERRAATRAMKEAMCANAAKLRSALAGRYEPPSRSSSPDIIVFNRRFGETDYLFAINDKRTFGDYVGQWGLLMEKGLPNEGVVAVRDAGRRVKAVYELSRGVETSFVRTGDVVEVPVKFSTNDGRLFAFLDARIAKIEAKAKVDKDGIDVTMLVLDESGKPLNALLPVDIRIYDAAGAELDGAGYCAAENGIAKAHVFTNLDDAPGAYRIVCRDRASGKSVTITASR